jgi:hypothetical protein
MRLNVVRIAVLLLVGGLGRALSSAQEPSASEYQVEAAFLYQFAKFVVWPAPALPADNAPLVIGVLGDDPLGAELEATVKNKTINGHPLRVLKLEGKSLPEARRCQIVFICPSEKRRLAEILPALKGASVLTVSKLDRFLPAGGMINFFIEDNRVRFEINDEAARQAGLKISAKLLSLARHKEGR